MWFWIILIVVLVALLGGVVYTYGVAWVVYRDYLTRQPELKGKNIYHLTKREIGKILGGSAGCFHTVDILADITAALAGLVPVQQPDARK